MKNSPKFRLFLVLTSQILRKTFSVLVFLALSLSISAKAENSEALKKFFKQKGISAETVGVWIKKEDDQVVELNGDRSMIPASLSKIVTAATTLSELPSNFSLKTELWIKGKVKDGVLDGDIILKGGGDPSFVSENMWFLVNEFRRTGITEIKGQILVDASRFDGETFSDSRQEQRVDRAYDAPVGAMSFNWNSVNVFVRPGTKGGETAQVFLDPVNDFVQLNNLTKTKKSGGPAIDVSRSLKSEKDLIEVRGSIGQNSVEFVSYKNISKPALWAGANFKEFLKQRGVKATGQVVVAKTPADAIKVSEYKSKALALIVADMQKFSNNFVAEMLVKNLAAEKRGLPGSLDKGMEVIHEYLGKIGLKEGTYSFVNPSGLTRDNKLSPQQIGQILEINKSEFRTFPEFISALPIAGMDGTLKKRMSDISEQVRAKTGLLTGVVGLAGFGSTKNKKPFTFVLIYNGPDNFTKIKESFDNLVREIVKESL